MAMTTHELHWTAGFLEGEGCFQGRHTGDVRIDAKQVQREPLERLRALFGGSMYVENSRPNKINVWALRGRPAAGLMMTLYGLMSPRRRQQIARALEPWKARACGRSYRTHCPQGHEYAAGDNTIWITAPNGAKRWRNCRPCMKVLRLSKNSYYKPTGRPLGRPLKMRADGS